MVKHDFEISFRCKISFPWELFFFLCIWDDVWSMPKNKTPHFDSCVSDPSSRSSTIWLSNYQCHTWSSYVFGHFSLHNMWWHIYLWQCVSNHNYWPFQVLTNILTPFRSYWLIIKNCWVIANVTSDPLTLFFYF